MVPCFKRYAWNIYTLWFINWTKFSEFNKTQHLDGMLHFHIDNSFCLFVLSNTLLKSLIVQLLDMIVSLSSNQLHSPTYNHAKQWGAGLHCWHQNFSSDHHNVMCDEICPCTVLRTNLIQPRLEQVDNCLCKILNVYWITFFINLFSDCKSVNATSKQIKQIISAASNCAHLPKSKIPMILNVIHHHKNPYIYIYNFL